MDLNFICTCSGLGHFKSVALATQSCPRYSCEVYVNLHLTTQCEHRHTALNHGIQLTKDRLKQGVLCFTLISYTNESVSSQSYHIRSAQQSLMHTSNSPELLQSCLCISQTLCQTPLKQRMNFLPF